MLAINHCNENGICHRDIKAENIMFTKNMEIKIIDFGMSKLYNQENLRNLKSKVGSPYYIAPEILVNDYYGFECDIWSLGIILYIMVSGYLPFNGKTNSSIFKQVMNAKSIKFVEDGFAKVSSTCKDLILKMLTYDPLKRIKVKDALNHPFITN